MSRASSQDTVDLAKTGTGHVILLHDSGGDRTQTVAALPLIIDGLRAEGFSIVPISKLLGVSRDVVMPPVPEGERASLLIVDAAFLALGAFNGILQVLFIVGLVLGCLRLLLLATLAIGQRFRRRPPGEAPLRVAVIVPAYNEVKVIDRTISSLLASEGASFEILVIDDGSTDGTYAHVEGAVRPRAARPRVHAPERRQGGGAQLRSPSDGRGHRRRARRRHDFREGHRERGW